MIERLNSSEQPKMPSLDMPTQLAVRDLLKEIKGFIGITWDQFGKELGEDGTVLEEMSRTKKTPSGEVRPKKTVPKEFALKLIAYCKARPGFVVSDDLKTKLRTLWGPPVAPEATPAPAVAPAGDGKKNRPHSFIGALGINEPFP
jgi:hypothetical protein